MQLWGLPDLMENRCHHKAVCLQVHGKKVTEKPEALLLRKKLWENENMDITREAIEGMIREIIQEQLDQSDDMGSSSWEDRQEERLREKAEGLIKVQVPDVKMNQKDRLDTGKQKDMVFTHDLFSLAESPRLGCGVMEMDHTTFEWRLNYDEIDYVIEGSLTIIKNGKRVTAGPGELILIPKGSSIQFSVPEKARFLYVTYPAEWNA